MKSSNGTDEAAPRRGAGIGLAVALGLLWGAAIGVTWYFYRENDSEGGVAAFVGRFHILLVHMPIGLLFIVPVMEMVGWTRWGGNARAGVPFVLWMAVLTAVVASVLGFLMMNAEDTAGRLMTLHMWTGLGVGLFAVLALIFKMARVGWLYTLTLLVAVGLTGVAGHFGGALVHEDDYLTEFAPERVKPLMEKSLDGMDEAFSAVIGAGEKAVAKVTSGDGAGPDAPVEPGTAVNGDADTDADADPDVVAATDTDGDATGDAEPVGDAGDGGMPEKPIAEQDVFAAFVLPIMEKKCTECHSEEKIKGKLRLDTHEMIMAGADGSDYPTVIPGDTENESELIVRVTLPDDDDDFMPPDGENQLTDQEIEVLKWWIAGGAKVEGTVADLEADEDMLARLAVVAEGLVSDDDEAVIVAVPTGIWPTLSTEEQQARLDAAHAAAAAGGFSILPISAEDSRLRVSAVNAAADFGDDDLAALEPVSERLVWLDVGRTQITDQGMELIGRMPNLERLHLEQTMISDAGVKHLRGLVKLEYLNLYGTDVTAAIFESLAELRSLRKLFLWETKVDQAAARHFQRRMSLEVNTGWDVAVVDEPTETEDAAPVEESEAPKAEPKTEPKSEPKPAPKAEPKTEPKSESKPAPKAEPKPAPKAEPKPAPKSEPKPAPKPAPKSKSAPAEAAKPTAA